MKKEVKCREPDLGKIKVNDGEDSEKELSIIREQPLEKKKSEGEGNKKETINMQKTIYREKNYEQKIVREELMECREPGLENIKIM